MMLVIQASAQEQNDQESSTDKAKKQAGKLKETLKKLEKTLSFKNFFHHDDSTQLAKQYIHEQHKLTKGKKDYPYDVDHQSLGLDVQAYDPSETFNLDYEVFGWYPYWEEDLYKSLNYSLLTTVAYFSYEVDAATGNPASVHDWETTALLDSAKAHGKKVLLSVTSFGRSNNRRFLKNEDAINALIDQLKSLLEKRQADGVCLDFEGIAASEKNRYSRFVALLSEELKKANNEYLIYLAIPAVDWEKYLDFEVLVPAVDRFVIMGYGYYGTNSKVAGPVAPLGSGEIWEPYNLSLSVDFYMANQVPSSKLILALPYYGVIWETEEGNMGAKVKRFVGNRTYDYIKTKITAPVQYDTVSQSAWISYVTNESPKRFRQCWFDNDSTLTVKLDFIKGKKLGGMGIWALGFDKGYPDLWEVIAKDMTNEIVSGIGGIQPTGEATVSGDDSGSKSSGGGDDSSTSDGADSGAAANAALENKASDIENLLNKITDYKTLMLSILFLAVLFGGAGFIIAMFQPNTREFFFGNTAHTVYYSAVVLLFLVVLLKWTGIINDLSVALILGFIAGAAGIYFINKIMEQMKKDMP